jgi:alkylated DNA nucleotide flippase Atl1
MTVRDDLHHLVDAVPEDRLPGAVELLRQFTEPAAARPRRVFRSAGTLSAESDLAARSEEILRAELGEDKKIA